MPEPAGAVVSVNVGLPRDVAWNGRIVRTAIFKSPVEGRVWAGRLNIAGDRQADLQGHGGEQRAIMVYQMDSYRFWSKELDRSDFVMGQFGENLTVEGLADHEVCIGDRFRIGGALVEVSQPRVTCYRVGIRLDNPQMAALLVAHKRPGFYLRVLEEGEIGAGDMIEKVAGGPEGISVAEMDALLYTADHPRPTLERALKIPALSPGWRQSMTDLLAAAVSGRAGNAGLTAAGPPLAWTGLRSLQVAGARLESADVRSFTLVDPDGSALPDAAPGQHIAVRVAPCDGPPVTRNYSLCGPPGRGQYRIAVKREPQGVASGFLHDHVQPGDRLSVSAPRGTFILPSAASPVVLVSAGVGVTPMLGMLYAAVAGAPMRPIWWLHAARDKAHHSFAEEIRALKAQHRFEARILFSRPGPGDREGHDYDLVGRLNPMALGRLCLPQEADFYLCGPSAFMAGVNDALRADGIDARRIHREEFGPEPVPPGTSRKAPHAPAGPTGEGPRVSFLRSGITAACDARFNSLLELAEACDVAVRWSCRAGVCHSCESGLVAGAVAYAPDPIDTPPPGSVLLCCARPTGDIELDL
jgi:ferredoxin-NADP reductase/MOSC domain-containing protein YiiM